MGRGSTMIRTTLIEAAQVLVRGTIGKKRRKSEIKTEKSGCKGYRLCRQGSYQTTEEVSSYDFQGS